MNMINMGEWLIALPDTEIWDSHETFKTKELAILHGVKVLTKWNNATPKERQEIHLEDDISGFGGVGMDEEQKEFVVGKSVKVGFPDRTGELLENLSDQAYSECGYVAENFLDDVTDEHKKELSDLIHNWAERNDYLPKFVLITEIEEVDVDYFS